MSGYKGWKLFNEHNCNWGEKPNELDNRTRITPVFNSEKALKVWIDRFS